jgi:hypothetical protein
MNLNNVYSSMKENNSAESTNERNLDIYVGHAPINPLV